MTNPESNNAIVAIDPGAKGGIAVKYGTQAVVAYPMPETEGDVVTLFSQIRLTATNGGSYNLIAVLEDQVGCVGPNMRVSATAMFTFGRGFGFILGALQSTGWRIHLVRPRKWQAQLSLGTKKDAGGKTAWKNKLKARAQQLYPNLHVTLSTADALLLLEYVLKKDVF